MQIPLQQRLELLQAAFLSGPANGRVGNLQQVQQFGGDVLGAGDHAGNVALFFQCRHHVAVKMDMGRMDDIEKNAHAANITRPQRRRKERRVASEGYVNLIALWLVWFAVDVG